MEFGVSIPGRGPLARPDLALKIATKAEALGYASLWVPDHVVLPASTARSTYPYSPTGRFPGGSQQDYLEPLAMLAYLAHATRRVRLGTSVLVVPYRNPLVTAKTLATIDVLSHGRVVLGAGAGWLREEFEALQAPPFEERGRVTDEYLELMRRVWTTDPVSFDGRYYRCAEVHALPKPLQSGGIPVWIGGHTDAAIRRAARLGDAWHPIGMRPPALLAPDEYAAKVARLHDEARKAGRDPSAIALTLRAPVHVRAARTKAPAGPRPLLQGSASEVLSDVLRYAELGVTHLVLDPVVDTLAAWVDDLERFAGEVRPRIRAHVGRPRIRAHVVRPRIRAHVGRPKIRAHAGRAEARRRGAD